MTVPYLPSADQELLLGAVLRDDACEAIESWNAWRERAPLDHLDLGSQRLLPLLLHRLERLGVSDPDLARYRSVARHIWLDNQLRLQLATQVFGMFAEAGIPSMPLKGIAVAVLYYGSFRLRGMNDIDILVPATQLAAAGRLLVQAGWRAEEERQLQSESYLATKHAVTFKNARQVDLDLHWHVSHQHCRTDSDEAFWRHAQPMTLNGLQVMTLSDTDHLFHALIHGGQPNLLSPIRWVVDATLIARKGAVDWDRLLDQAEAFGLVRRLQRTLFYLKDVFALAMPAAAIERLAGMTPNPIERFEERMSFSRLPRTVKSLAWSYAHYRRNAAQDRSFLRYLQDARGLESLGQVTTWVARRVGRGWPLR